MTTTLGQAKAEAARLLREGDFARALLAYYQILGSFPFDFQVRFKIADVLARTGFPRFAAAVYQAVARHDIYNGHPLPALVACAALEGLGHDTGPQRNLVASTYCAGAPKLARFASRPAPVPAETPLPALDLETNEPYHIVADWARHLAVDLGGNMAYQEQLHAIPFLSELAHDPLLALLGSLEVRRLNDGDVVTRQGDRGDALYLVAAGELRVFIVAERGEERTVARLYENALFGEMALATGQPRTASVAVVGEADVIEISRATLDRITTELPIVREVLDRFTRERLIRNLLHTSPLFRPFSRVQQSALLRRFEGHEVEPGTEVIQHGQPGPGLFVVLTGELEAVAGGEADARVLGRLKPGDVCGEMSLLTSDPTSATVRALTPCTLLFLARSIFEDTVAAIPEVRAYLEGVAKQRGRALQLGAQPLPTDAADAAHEPLL